MSVILFILKLIGIILLVLLGIIVTLLLLVVFVPIRYDVSGEMETEIAVHVKITWLLHLISFVLDYEKGETVTCLRIMGIRKKAKADSVFEEEAWEDEPENTTVDETADEPSPQMESALADSTETIQEDNLEEDNVQEDNVQADGDIKKAAFIEKLRSHIQTFGGVARKLKSTAGQLSGKLSVIKDNITDEANQSVVRAVILELGHCLKHFKFRKLVMDLRFSTGDPAKTGQTLGVLCLFPILYQYQVNIFPDFEADESYIKGTFEIKGHVRTVHLLTALLHLWKKKEVRVLVKKLLDK